MKAKRKTGEVAIVAVLFLTILASCARLTWANTWVTLDMPGADRTYARGIDGDNIVGHYSDINGSHGFLYDMTTQSWTTLDMPGASWTRGCDIDGDNIVGYYRDASPNMERGFLYNLSTQNWITLEPVGATRTHILSIDNTNIVGFYADASWYYHSVLYNGTIWTNLDIPLIPYGIDGSSIVGSYISGMIETYHGFFYDGTQWITLDMPGVNNTALYDIDGGNIVGSYGNGFEMLNHGLFYDGAQWVTLDMPGSTSTVIYGIDGVNLVGCYEDTSGKYHGFFYTIPEPASILFLTAGILGLRPRKNKN